MLDRLFDQQQRLKQLLDRLAFQHIVAVDCEFHFGGHASFEEAARSGERPRPVCMVARELRSGQIWKQFADELRSQPPFPTNRETCLITYYGSAEFGFFKACGWDLKDSFVLDLFTEFRAHTNGRPTPNGASLLGR